jgi:Flp pilus assembly protein TadG
MTRRFGKLCALDQGGNAVIELGLIAPIFATLIIGVVDITTAFNRKLDLEQAVQRSIERVMQTTAEETVEQNIKQEAAEAAGIPEDDVTVNYTLTCAGVATDYDQECVGSAAEVRYITVQATTEFVPVFPLTRLGFIDESFTINVETGIRTQ